MERSGSDRCGQPGRRVGQPNIQKEERYAVSDDDGCPCGRHACGRRGAGRLWRRRRRGSGPGGCHAGTDRIEGATDEVASVTGEIGQAVDNGLTVQLNEQNTSGESGTATFTINDDGTTHVVLQVTGGGTEPQPAHIHEGTCDDLNPQPAFPLQDVVNGTSETDVDISLDDLTLSSYAVNVHESAEEADVYVACGDITDVNG